jgi:hypothetical protein
MAWLAHCLYQSGYGTSIETHAAATSDHRDAVFVYGVAHLALAVL